MKFKNRIGEYSRELKDSLYLVCLQGVNQLLPILLIPYLMYTLGASGYGFVGFSLSVIQVVTLVVDFGFDLSATKHIAQVKDNRKERDRVFWNIVVAKTILLFISVILLVLLTSTVSVFILYRQAIWLTFPMAVGSAYSCMWFFQGIGKIKIYSVLNTLSKVVLLPLLFYFVKSPSDYVWAALLQALVFVFTAIISSFYIIKSRWVAWRLPNWFGIIAEVKESLPLFLSKASTTVYTQLFVVVLGFYCTTETIGKYTSAERIMRALSFLLLVPINQSFFPKLSSLAIINKSAASKLFVFVRKITVFIVLLISSILFCGGEYLPILLGDDYNGIDNLLRVMALAPIAIGMGSVYGQMGLVAMGGQKEHACFRDVYFIVALFALLSCSLLVPFYGEYGAAWAMVASEWMVWGLMYYYFSRRLH